MALWVKVKWQTSGRRIPRYMRCCPFGQPTLSPAHACQFYNTFENSAMSTIILEVRKIFIILMARVNDRQNNNYLRNR